MLGIVPRVSLQVASGQLSSYAKTADSGHAMVREFCTACGTLLFLKGARFPEIVMFTVSSLDDPRGNPARLPDLDRESTVVVENPCRCAELSAWCLGRAG